MRKASRSVHAKQKDRSAAPLTRRDRRNRCGNVRKCSVDGCDAKAKVRVGKRVLCAQCGARETAKFRTVIEECDHEIALAIRTQSVEALAEALYDTHDSSPPLDSEHNPPLHYACYFGSLKSFEVCCRALGTRVRVRYPTTDNLSLALACVI